jgi:hypothetical protein
MFTMYYVYVFYLLEMVVQFSIIFFERFKIQKFSLSLLSFYQR